MARALWPASQPARQPLASPCWTEAPPKDGTGECHSSHISPYVTNGTRAGQSGWEEVGSEHSEQKQGSQCTQASPAGASPHPACGTYSDGGIRASSLGRPGHLDWAECPPPRFSPGSPGRQDLHPTSRHTAILSPGPVGRLCPRGWGGRTGLPMHPLQGSLLPAAAWVLV